MNHRNSLLTMYKKFNRETMFLILLAMKIEDHGLAKPFPNSVVK